MTLTPATEAQAEELRSESTCGISTWTAGSSVSILDKTCDGDLIGSAGDEEKNLIQINGDTLVKGDLQGEADEEGYPEDFATDTLNVLDRQ